MTTPTLLDLLAEYDRSLGYTRDLLTDLSPEQIVWRPHDESSAIGWHLGHQAAVAHFMVRNLTAAEPKLDPAIDELMDSATFERDRGDLPEVATILDYRATIADRVRFRVSAIDEGNVGAPAQLRVIAATLMQAVINHEYQHSKWIGEVRADAHGLELPPEPVSPLLSTIDGYLCLDPG